MKIVLKTGNKTPSTVTMELFFESGAITRDLMTAKVVKFKYFCLKRMLFSGDSVIRYNQVEVSLASMA